MSILRERGKSEENTSYVYIRDEIINEESAFLPVNFIHKTDTRLPFKGAVV